MTPTDAPPDLEYTHYPPTTGNASARHLRAAPAIPPPWTSTERHDAEIAALGRELNTLRAEAGSLRAALAAQSAEIAALGARIDRQEATD